MAGSNTQALLRAAASTIKELTQQRNDIDAEIKSERAAAKSSGLDVKALNKIVKEMLMDSDDQQAQLRFEWEVDAYRQAVGLPTEVSGMNSGGNGTRFSASTPA